MYWAVQASEVMKMNPRHYISLIIPLPVSGDNSDQNKTVRYNRVKLLRPNDTLVLGRAYRLLTTQEVMKVLKAKKQEKMKKNESEPSENLQMNSEKQSTSCQAGEEDNLAIRQHRHQQRSRHTKSWRPSLHSISESGS